MLVCYEILQYIAAYYITEYNISQYSLEDYAVYYNTCSMQKSIEYITEFWSILIEYYNVLKHIIIYDSITVYYTVL